MFLPTLFQVADLPDVPAPGHREPVHLETMEALLLLSAETGQGDEDGSAGPHSGGDRYSFLSFVILIQIYQNSI